MAFYTKSWTIFKDLKFLVILRDFTVKDSEKTQEKILEEHDIFYTQNDISFQLAVDHKLAWGRS